MQFSTCPACSQKQNPKQNKHRNANANSQIQTMPPKPFLATYTPGHHSFTSAHFSSYPPTSPSSSSTAPSHYSSSPTPSSSPPPSHSQASISRSRLSGLQFRRLCRSRRLGHPRLLVGLFCLFSYRYNARQNGNLGFGWGLKMVGERRGRGERD